MQAPRPLWLVVLALAGALCAAPAPGAQGQPQSNPVYLDDSPAAREALLGVRSQIDSGNLDGAVRVLQKLLDEEPERVVASAEDPDLFLSVRTRVHQTLVATPALLERYRSVEGPKAQRALEAGDAARVERSWLLTPAGVEAVLRIAQRHKESGRFHAAWLTLRQLDEHPDRRGAAARDGADLLAAVARYLDRAEAWEAAERWASQARAREGAEWAAGGREALAWPEAASRTGMSPLNAAGEVDLEGLVSKALWTVPVGAPLPPVRDPGAGGSPLPPYARDLRIMPTAAGEMIYVNDGSTISAWDRFTLIRRWSVGLTIPGEPGAEAPIRIIRGRMFRSGQPEDPSTVTVRGRTLAAVTGLGTQGDNRREGDPRLNVLDADTGRERWVSAVTDLDEQLSGGTLRAVPVIAEGAVVAGVRKANASRRLTSLYLVGLNEADGSLLWRRLVASAGALPFGGRAALVDAATEDGGLLYVTDQIGAIGAYEAHSGRPLWIRRFDVQAWLMSDSARPWQVNAPILDGGTLLCLSPDRAEVLRVDARTGDVLARRSADRMGMSTPRYLLLSGGKIVLVGDDRVSVTSAEDFPTGEVRMSRRFPDNGIRGRVLAAHSRLLAPVVDGVAIIDLDRPSDPPVQLTLESSGNLLALSSQLVAVDDGNMHSYLLWDAAERVLTERMRQDPRNPGPAVTFAELAYRAGKQERILDAVDAAIGAIESAPEAETADSARRRLFGSLLAMANATQEPAAPDRASGAGAFRLTDDALLGKLIGAMGRVATDAGERATHLMTLGRFEETHARFAQAVGHYQRILDEPPLAGATWSGPQMALRAELEATWRLQRLLNEHGPAIYAAHEAAAQAELAALGAGAAVQRLESLARRYPVSTAAPQVWLRIAELHTARGRTQASIAALESGLRALRWRDDADPALLGALAGRLVRAMESQGQIASAAEILRGLTLRRADLILSDERGEFDAAALLSQLTEQLSARNRWPRVGPVAAQGVQIIPGWQLLRQRIPDITPAVGRCIAMTNGDEVAVWAPSETGDMVLRWSETIPGRGVDLLRVEDDNAYLFYDTRQGGVLEKVSAAEGRALWRTPAFPELFRKDDAPGPDSVRPITVPRDRFGLLVDLILAMDDRTATLVERSGRAVGLDAQSGQPLWSGRVPLNLVIDTDLRGGTLAVAGDRDGGPTGFRNASTILLLDARTGQVTQRIDSSWGQVRWLRLLDGGVLLAGFDGAIVSFDAARAEANWVLDDRRIHGSQEAWAVAGRVFVQDADRTVWVVSATTGQLLPQAVRLPREFKEEFRPIFAAEVAPRRDGDGSAAIAFTTTAGVALVTPDGDVVGEDALPEGEGVLPPAHAEGRAVTIETVAFDQSPDGQSVFRVHQIETGSARLTQSRGVILGARPNRLALIDGHIALSAGSTTVILKAPPQPPE